MKKKEEENIYRDIRVWVVVVVCCLGGVWFAQGSDFFLYKLFAPKYEQARRETFEQSKAYREGMAQELRRMRLEYVQAKPEQKAALASVILHQYADCDVNSLPLDLQQFLDEIKRGALQ